MDLSIIIVNFNTCQITSDCIGSIYDNEQHLNFEIIVVDNNSQDQSVEKISHTYPSVRIIPLAKNIGFGGANNIGISIAKGKYLLLLNSDTLVLSDCLLRCFEFMESKFAAVYNIGVIGCKLLNEDFTFQMSVLPYRKNLLSAYLMTANPVFEKIATVTGTNKHKNFDEGEIQSVGDVSGAFMFMRKEVVSTTGAFDEDFFMYCEDSEWCQDRIGRKFNLYYFPNASIIHLGGRSAPQDIMYIQARLSLSLLWFKRGLLKYSGYLLITYFTILMTPLFLPMMSRQSRKNFLKYSTTYFKLIPYIFRHIPAFHRSHQPNKKLIYHKLSIS